MLHRKLQELLMQLNIVEGNKRKKLITSLVNCATILYKLFKEIEPKVTEDVSGYKKLILGIAQTSAEHMNKLYNKEIRELIQMLLDLYDKYLQLKNSTRIPVRIVSIEPDVEPKVETTRIIKEESDTNFGHQNLISKGNVNFPPRADSVSPPSGYGYGYGYEMRGGSYSHESTRPSGPLTDAPFDKQAEIQRALDAGELDFVSNQKEYFELYRYGIDKLNRPNDDDVPTLCLSLFIPNDKKKEEFKSWSNKYFKNQLKTIIAFKYYFPNGNIRIYFDWFMLDKFENLTDTILTINDNFEYIGYEEEDKKIKEKLDRYFNEISKINSQIFNNELERFLITYNLACKFESSNNSVDFFVYKFKGPFTESMGHITNGSFGQLIRYISSCQQNYIYNGDNIKRIKSIVFRDGHATCPGKNDSEWIRELHKLGENKELYLLGHSNEYLSGWHDVIKCNPDGNLYHKSIYAGYSHLLNRTDSNLFMDYENFVKTIGSAFIVNNMNELPLKNHRPILTNGKKDYDYGIDEYVLSSLLNSKDFINKLLYLDTGYILTFTLLNTFNESSTNPNYTIFNTVTMIIYSYLIENDMLDIEEKYSAYEIISKIEELRNNRTLSDDKDLSLLLSIFPNKYLSFNTTCDNQNNHYFIDKNNCICNKENLLGFIDNIEMSNDTNNIYTRYFKGQLFNYGISCRSSSTLLSQEWCKHPYIYNKEINYVNCRNSNFISGFYYVKSPSLDIGILRQPSDLKYAISVLEKNKLVIPLNKSDYKLKVESNSLREAVDKSVDNKTTGHIKSALQNVILKFGPIDILGFGLPEAQRIAGNVSGLNPAGTEGTQSAVWCPLIWKALNYSGYDVPPEWFVVKLKSDKDYEKFNDLVKELARIEGWTEYALEVLTKAGDEEFADRDNDFDSDKVNELSERYNDSYNNSNFSNLKMASYEIKYYKLGY